VKQHLGSFAHEQVELWTSRFPSADGQSSGVLALRAGAICTCLWGKGSSHL